MFVFIQTLILVCLSFQHRFLFSNWKFFFLIFFSCVDDSIHKNKKNTDKRSFVDPVVVIGFFSLFVCIQKYMVYIVQLWKTDEQSGVKKLLGRYTII